MDTISINRRLQWIALIILLIHCYNVSARRCPQGQIEHQYSPRVGVYYIRCCYPTRCGVGKEVVMCTTNGTQDTCQNCNHSNNQSLRTSSYTMERCEPWQLDSNCKYTTYNPLYEKTAIWQMKRCMCDIELGLMYEKPESSYEGAPADTYCQRMVSECPPGFQPTVEGTCEPCQENYFKAGVGFTLCEPKTNCAMLGLKVTVHADSTEDDTCSVPEPVTTQIPIVAEKTSPTTNNPKPPSVPSVDTSPPEPSTTSASIKHAPSEAASTSEDKDIIGPVIGSILFVVVVILVIIIIFFYKRQRGKSFCCGVCAKKCADSEIGMTSLPGNQRTKNVIGGGSIPHHLNGGDKVNNNINGGLEYMPGLQGQNVTQSFFPPDPTAHQYTQIPQIYPTAPSDPTTRRGILRNVVIAQTQNRHPEFESMGPEKLHIPMDRSEPNYDLGENDPLLVPETPRGAAAFQNFASTNSPPVLPGGRGPAYISSNGNYGNVPSSPPPPPHGHGSPQTPTPAFATFTRSTSVIANPEGEVDEEAIEARVPRFSQLLPDGDTSSVQVSYPNNRAVTERATSNGQVTTQIRAPTQRVNQQPVHNTQVKQKRPAKPAQQRQGYTPVTQTGTQENLGDHCIMNLKEQQLAESLHSSSDNSSSSLPLNGPVDVGNLDTLRTVTHSSGTQQTELKTQNLAISSNPFTSGARAEVLLPKAVISEAGVPSSTEHKQTDARDNGCTAERIGQPSAGNNEQNLHEIRSVVVNAPHIIDKRGVHGADLALTGAGNNDATVALDRRPFPSGDQQKSCIRTSPAEEANVSGKKQRYNRTVSFDEDDLAQTVYKHNTTPPDMQHPAHAASVENSSRVRAPLRSVSDPEQKIPAGNNAEDEEETERKCVSLEYNNSSTTSSKTSVSSDVSGSDSNSGSPSRAAHYRRSQSENAPSSSETAHKPPPRSMSEEKPQKADRPIAKVKPMPASDKTTSNQTSAEGAADLQTQIPVTVSSSSPNTTNILSYSSEDTDSEDSDSTRPSRLEEEEEDEEEEGSQAP